MRCVLNGEMSVRRKVIVACVLTLVCCGVVAAQNQVLPIFNSQGVQIGPGKYFYVNFHVDVYLKRARLVGNVMARGGGNARGARGVSRVESRSR